MIIENLSTLKIHKLTQKQYDRQFATGNIKENEIYLTPDISLTLWQPDTEYKIGDVVIANVYEQESNSTVTSICYCIQNHKSLSGDFLLFEYEGDKWIRSNVRAVYDACDNLIHLHYATKEELKNLELPNKITGDFSVTSEGGSEGVILSEGKIIGNQGGGTYEIKPDGIEFYGFKGYFSLSTQGVDGNDTAKASWQRWLDVLTSLKDGTQVNSLYQKTEKDDTALPMAFKELHPDVKETARGSYDKVYLTGENATSLGTSVATGKRSFAGGSSNLSTGKASVTIGADNYNAADNGATFGYANAMLGDYGLVGGSKHILRDDNQTVGGHGNDVSGHCANAFGDGLIVRGYGQTVIGTYNNPVQDAKLIIGDGSSDARHNIFVVTKEGNAYVDDKELATKEEIGNIETALDNIIAIQNQLIGGEV